MAGSGDPQVRQQIEQLEDQGSKANVNFDTATIGRMVADEYFVMGSGGIENRAEALRDLAIHNPDFTPLYSPDSAVTVRVYDNIAVATAVSRSEVRNNKNGEVYPTLGRYLDVWLHRNGKWQVIASSSQDVGAPTTTLKQQLMRAEQDYSDMFNKRDSLAFQRLVSDSVTFAAGTNAVETKPELWVDVKESDIRTSVFHAERAYVSGADVGIVNGTMDRTQKDGTALHLRYANTWVYRGGSWRLLSRQLVPAPLSTH
jgi:ketosteroid isomerase-like protein